MKLTLLSRPAALLALALSLAAPFRTAAADSQESRQTKERELIAILQSDAPPQDKAIPSKKLAIYGSKDAVPALAALLPNPDLSSWVRIALEAIPDPAASEALRDALGKVQGRLLIGVIDSLGVRHDTQAVDALTQKINDTDTAVACAAAEALGQIGGPEAAKSLASALDTARDDVRSSVAYGCVVSAESLLAKGKTADATRLYDRIRQAKVPKQRVLEATRGAILARGKAGLPLLVEQLQSPDIAFFGIGLRTARELPGREVTDTLARELDRAVADRQIPVLLALADRNDAAVLPKLHEVAESGPKPVKVASLGLLDRFRDLSSVPVLLDAAAGTDPEVARAGKNALTRLGGKEAEADLLNRLRLASGKSKQVLIEIAGQRRIAGALPVVLRTAESNDGEQRRAAIEAIGVLGQDQQTADLVRLLGHAQTPGEKEDIETALLSICGRNGAKCLPGVLPLATQSDPNSKVIGLHALAAIGGPEALGAVRHAMDDSNSTVQDEAVRTLSNWPNTWPEDSAAGEALLNLAKTGKKPLSRLQGLQGYLQYLQEDKKLKNEEKLSSINELLPSINSPEEKRLTIAALGTIPSSGSLERLISYTEDPAVSEEACLAIVKVAVDNKQKEAPAELRRKALQTVVDKTSNDSIKKKAQDGLKRIK